MEEYTLEEEIERNDQVNETIETSTENNISDNMQNPFIQQNILNYGDIAKNKQENNINNIKDNQEVNMMIIKDSIINGGAYFGINNLPEVTKNVQNNEKQYDLSIVEQLSEFIENIKDYEYFVVAVILCVFDYVALNDLQDLKTKLINELPVVSNDQVEEKNVYQNPLIPISKILKTIKGKMFVLDNGENCIGLGVNRQEALKNVWQQFPYIRHSIARWLIEVSSTFKYRTNFQANQITTAFVNIIKLDFNAGTNHFFQRLYSNQDKYWLLGFIALELYCDLKYRNKILPFIYQWAESESWKWKSAIFVYAKLEKDQLDLKFNKKVRKSLKNCLINLSPNDPYKTLNYIGMLMINSECLRTLVISVFYELFSEMNKYYDKRLICNIYLALLYYGYNHVTADFTLLPLIVCDNKNQLKNIFPIINIILSRYDTRNLLFFVLNDYLKEISRYDVPLKIINSLKAFFWFVSKNCSHLCNDIKLFLNRCNCKLTNELLEYLEPNMLTEK